MNRKNNEPHSLPQQEQTSLQDYILYIAVGGQIYTTADLQKEKGED